MKAKMTALLRQGMWPYFRLDMECREEEANPICWFCKKGRHDECMKKIPAYDKSDGPHDCTFDTKLIDCQCNH